MSKNIVRDYRILKKIGQGGMGQVWLAEHLHLNHKVAIKALSPRLSRDPGFGERFVLEAKAQVRLDHPNIVKVLDFFIHNERHFMVSEWVRGPSLEVLLDQAKVRSQGQVLAILKPVLAALNYAHSQGIVHRDVKPGNILVGEGFKVKVADFGLAAMVGVAPPQAGNGADRARAVGSPHYMSPEQIRDPACQDHRIDVYATGIILFEALTGRLPFDAEEVREIWRRHLGQPAPDPRQFVPDLNPTLAQITLKALEKDPEQRFAGCGAFLSYLELYEKERGQAAARPRQRPIHRPTAETPPQTESVADEPVLELDFEAVAATPDPPVETLEDRGQTPPDQGAVRQESPPAAGSVNPLGFQLPLDPSAENTKMLRTMAGLHPGLAVLYAFLAGIIPGYLFHLGRGPGTWGLPLFPTGVLDLFYRRSSPADLFANAFLFCWLFGCFMLAYDLARRNQWSNTFWLKAVTLLLISGMNAVLHFMIILPSLLYFLVNFGFVTVQFSPSKGFGGDALTSVFCFLSWYGMLVTMALASVLAGKGLNRWF